MRNINTIKAGLLHFYVVTLLAIGIGYGIGLYRIWQNQLQTTRITLERDARLASTFIDSALTSTEKSLASTKERLREALDTGPVEEATAHRILALAEKEFVRFSSSEVYGWILLFDKQGQLLASSGEYPTQAVDSSDRYFYQDLRDHPSKSFTIGPIIKARTTGKYVFHMGVPILDKKGEFYGVLIQQLQIDDLYDLLDKNFNGLADKILMHHVSQGISFVYPAPEHHETPANTDAVAQVIDKSELKNGCILLDNGRLPPLDSLLVGFATSARFGFVTSATLPMAKVLKSFVINNLWLDVYFLIGGLFISYLFWRLYRQYITLEMTQFVARHDALTELHNRWALNEELPVLLHESMRRQTPMSFLFIDIDHFKQINDTYDHATGDAVLKEVGKTIDRCLRRPLDFVCRWGGEEFVALLSDTSEDSAVMLAESLMNAVGDIKIKDIKLTLSIGIKTTFITMESIVHNHLNDAEETMMLAKRNGRAHYRIFGEECHANLGK